jgi:hypothetical protein
VAAVVGSAAEFHVSVTSATPVRYQWRLSSADVPAQTNAILALTNIQPADFGEYTVRVANDDGAVLSDPAHLTEALAPCVSSFGFTQTRFTITFQTEVGPVYTVEYKDDVDTPIWLTLTNHIGTGTLMSVTDPGPSTPRRFYRVRIR